jgi:hypothetical protein
MQHTLPTPYHYLRLRVDSHLSTNTAILAVDALTVRRAIQDALAQSFGTTNAHTYLDVLYTGSAADESAGTTRDVVVRLDPRCVLHD